MKTKASDEQRDKRSPVVIGTGLVALDLVLSADPGNTARYFAGGSCGNVLAILGLMGWDTYPIARLRPGTAAEQIRTDLARWNVKTDYLERRRSGSTPIIIQRITANVQGWPTHRFTWSCPGCGSMLPSYKALLLPDAHRLVRRLPQANVFFFDRVSPAALVLAQHATNQGAMIVFEPSGIGNPKLFSDAVRLAHILKYSRERLGNLEIDPLQGRPKLVVETLGDEGLRYMFGSDTRLVSWKRLPAFPVRTPRDSAGSGDWCTAGLLHRLVKHSAWSVDASSLEHVEAALRFGQALASWNCAFEGARGGMYVQSWEQIQRVVNSILAGELLENEHIEKPHPDVLRCVCPACRRRGRSEQAVGSSKR